jgi:hypothetical protein
MRKAWRWVGVFSPELMLCAGSARVGLLLRRWWAVALPDGTLRQGHRGVRMRTNWLGIGNEVGIALIERPGEEVTSETPGRNVIWTRKQGGVPAKGLVRIDGRDHHIDARAIIDDSRGHHDRHTSWYWSAGIGTADDGTPVAWNLVDGIHDGEWGSERRVWRGDQAMEVGPVEFAPDLSRVGSLEFNPWAERTENINLLVIRSRYRQPFGTFAGELPDGTRLREGYGVMEEHDALW